MAGRPPPPKPWERASGTPSCCSNPASDSLPKPWERPQGATETITPSSTVSALAAATPDVGLAVSRPNPARPWERPGAGSAAGATTPYGTSTYGSSYNSPYSSSYGASSYGGGYGTMYSSPYSRPYGSYGGYGGYGSSMYGGGGMYGGSSMYGGGGMYGGGAYSGGMLGRPMGMPGPFDPNDPMGPPAPPSAWQAMLQSVQGVMHFFGRLSFLVDENAHAVHFFVTALLQLLDRFGSLYGELARFILRLLGFKSAGKRQQAGKGQEAGGAEAQAPGAPAAVGAAGAALQAGGLLRQRPVAAGLPLGSSSSGGGAGEWNSLWGSAPGGS